MNNLETLQQTIKLIQRAYNNCPNPSLRGKSPNYVLFGVEDRFLSQKHNIPLEEKNDEDRCAELNQFRKEVPKILSENFKKYAAHFNKSKTDIQFDKNEEVLVKRPKHIKTETRYEGPFVVTKILGPTAYAIDMGGKHEIIHAERLKKYYRRNK